ncbi:iron ABC transporter substrate-binding protein [Salipaludibacillus neizhouensis]|uniref:Iron ABC transporter substrate-binding protein n=2 Tax=Salipaludibacillus neizhouensis TaxID=885475 RepID=A0A3A9K783_9BACI|nr:iron-siderophore ABC transporter substrate-binding protein [Salipaludibacillus neizhouensis]RKL67338.1 iron ABC transporter substrate-binding protein [Salipaludibacillus neizhouensis]
MKKTKIISGLVSSLFLLTVFTACGANEEANSAETVTNNAVESESESETSDNEVRIVEHALGETEIVGTPETVVTLYQGANDVITALEIKPVGIVESWTEKPIYEYLREDLEGIEIVGEETQPNLEAISELEPDLIIASLTRHEEIYDHLSDIAPTVVGEAVYDWKDTLNIMGQALNKEEEADQLLEDYNTRIADFKEEMGDDLPIEVAITNFRADHARIFYMGYAGGILQDAGFTRPEGHDDPEEWGIKLSSKESIPEADADMIFNFNSGTETEQIEQTFKEWTSHPLWGNLEAVKNDQVVMVEEVPWNSAGGYISAHLMLDDLYEIFEIEE